MTKGEKKETGQWGERISGGRGLCSKAKESEESILNGKCTKGQADVNDLDSLFPSVSEVLKGKSSYCNKQILD
jgi:hypothetical protein